MINLTKENLSVLLATNGDQPPSRDGITVFVDGTTAASDGHRIAFCSQFNENLLFEIEDTNDLENDVVVPMEIAKDLLGRVKKMKAGVDPNCVHIFHDDDKVIADSHQVFGKQRDDKTVFVPCEDEPPKFYRVLPDFDAETNCKFTLHLHTLEFLTKLAKQVVVDDILSIEFKPTLIGHGYFIFRMATESGQDFFGMFTGAGMDVYKDPTDYEVTLRNQAVKDRTAKANTEPEPIFGEDDN